MNTYKDIYKRKKTKNDINPTTGLPMSGGGIDVGGTPYGENSSNSFDDAGYDGFNNIANYWSWKVDVVLILTVIAINVYFWID